MCAHTPELEDLSHTVYLSTTLVLYTGHVTMPGWACLLPAQCATKTQSAHTIEMAQQLHACSTCTPNSAGNACAYAAVPWLLTPENSAPKSKPAASKLTYTTDALS